MSVHPVKLKVAEVITETAEAISIAFETPSELLDYQAGQFLTLIANVNGESIRRAYSLCSSPMVDANLCVTVKRVEGGKMSNWLPQNIKAGMEMEVLPPIGHFTFVPSPGKKRHIVLIGAGSGITPLFSILKAVLTHEPNSFVSLIYGNRSEESIIYKNKLEQLREQYPSRFKLVNCLTQPPDVWYGAKGRISVELLEEMLHHLQPASAVQETQYYMCGPQGMMETVEKVLAKKGVLKDKIHREIFHSNIDDAAKQAAVEEQGVVTREVTILLEGKEYKVKVEPNSTILESALGMDVDMPYSCQSGLCTACRGKCLSGKVHMEETEGLSDDELDSGYVLTCVGHPLTADVVIEIG